eukprot:GFUD01103209.1.p1 GENE.GFUD01103209.1~~GFUD01103209.1.p1  ORF type:complete len:322 (+),score=51.88 GFUD01103209.1:86-1051(+)
MTTENFAITPTRNNKENSATKRQPRRQNHKRAYTVGHPFNLNKSAYVLESEGLSVVPYFKKTPMPRDSPRHKWSRNEITNQPTITRKENYANGRWSETPPKTVLPKPPSHWLTPRNQPLRPLTSTLKSLPSFSSFSSCSVEENDDDDIISMVSGIDDVSSSGYASRLCQESVYDSGFSQLLSEASLSRLASFSIGSSVTDSCEDVFSQASSHHPPSDFSESEVEVEVETDEPKNKENVLLASIMNQVECEPSYEHARKEFFKNISSEEEMCKPVSKPVKDDSEKGDNVLCSILASLKSDLSSEKEERKDDILSTLFTNMKC